MRELHLWVRAVDGVAQSLPVNEGYQGHKCLIYHKYDVPLYFWSGLGKE
jgi:hypothetical protein